IALAGGALLFNHNDLTYQTVVDLQAIPELRQISAEPNGITLGAAASLQTVVEAEAVPAFLKRALVRAIPLNIRNGTSVGESLMAHHPPREWLAALVACDAAATRLRLDGTSLTESVVSLADGSATLRE